MIGTALSTRDLVKRYGRRRALDGLTLSVPRGGVLGLVGPNGAGKTTWMMTVAGMIVPSGGTIDLLGQGPFDADVHAGRLGFLPQDSELPLEATPAGLLHRYARLQGMRPGEAVQATAAMLKTVNLDERAASPIRTLSHGMRKRVALAQSFLGCPDVVLLDEPLNGLDPVEADRVRRFLLTRRGRQTIVISSHNLHDVEALCTHVAFVEQGRVVRMDALDRITRAAERVAYALGGEVDRTALVAALSQVLPMARFSWQGDVQLVCECDEVGGVAEINRLLLPILLARASVLSVVPGVPLEEVALSVAQPSARDA